MPKYAMVPMPVANGRQYSANIPTVGNADVAGNISKWTAKFDASAEQRLHFLVPDFPNRSGSTDVSVRLRWRANATTGDCVWKVYRGANGGYQSSGGGAPNGETGSNSATTTTSGTALRINETVVTFTHPLSPGSILPFTVARDAANAADTLTVDAELLEVLWEYQIDNTISKEYIWIPPNAFAIPSGSSASLTEKQAISSDINHCYALLMGLNDKVDAKITVPANYQSNMKWSFWCWIVSSFQTMRCHLDMADIAMAGASDPALTAGANNDCAAGGADWVKQSPLIAVAVTPVAGDELVMRLTRVTSGSDTGNFYMLGMLIEYVASSKNPAVVRMDPSSAALPTTNPATLAVVSDTNTAKGVLQYANNLDKVADFLCHLPSIYGSGGTLRIRWRANTASGNARFRVDTASPALATDSDPALSSGTVVSSACGGANVVNELTVDVSAGLAASDLVHIRVNRIGSDVLDTCEATVELLEVVLESTIT